jgi:hypothetical protein
MTTADHRHDTDVHEDVHGDRTTDRGYDQDPTEFDTSRVSGGYADAHGATTDDGHRDETTGERSRADRLDTESTDTQDMSNRLDGADTYGESGTTGDDTERREGGYAARHGDDTASMDSSGQHTVDVDSGTGREHGAVGDGTPAVASGTSTDTGGTGGTAGSDLERLVPVARVEVYTSRWDSVKGEFVDEPRQAVAKADKLVGELLDELDQLFRKQRSDLEHGLDADETSTEDLRLALRKYRSFFDRLLAL